VVNTTDVISMEDMPQLYSCATHTSHGVPLQLCSDLEARGCM